MIDAISPLAVRSLPVGAPGPAGRPAAAVTSAVANESRTDFASVLGRAIADFGSQLREAEATSIGGVTGTASMQDVVERVMSAEQSLQAVIAVRDKVVSAYQEISRMAI
jgi:flagellar hook-basal body complex protein FliE